MAVLAFALSAVMAPFGSALSAEEGASNKIIVSGASGGLAGEAISALLGRGVKLDELILVTRTPEKLESYAFRGAEVRAGDFT
jgi:NADP-dependent 3-hydroxy acid dehydrogenase YdfG